MKFKHILILIIILLIISIICIFEYKNEYINLSPTPSVQKLVQKIEEKNLEIVVSEDTNWKASFSVEKYDENGKLILYEVDEKQIPKGYEKEIEGTIITNKLKQYEYRVEYYFDNIKDNNLTEFNKAFYNEEISTYIEKIDKYSKYELRKVENLGLKISTNSNDNVIRVYYSTKPTIVTATYVDYITANKISNDEVVVLDNASDNNKKPQSKEIENYEFIPYLTTSSSYIDENNIYENWIYNYKYKSTLKVNYIDKYSNQIITFENKYGLQTDIVTTSAKEFDGYKLIEKPEIEEYTLSKNIQEVNYYYARATIVNVKYLEKDTNEIIETEVVIEGFEGKEYKTIQKEIPGYTFKETLGITEGNMSRENSTVIYYYLANTTLQVDYIDKYTNEILDTVTFNGLVSEKVITEEKQIDGYTLLEKPESNEFILTKEKQYVKYFYAKNSIVTINYIDKATNEVLEKEEIRGFEGYEYKTFEKEILNYTLVDIPNNKNGIMTRDEIIVNYLYLYNSEIVIEHIDKNTNEILEFEIKNGFEGDYLKTSAKDIKQFVLIEKPDIEEYIFDKSIQTIKYYYVHISSGIIEKHIDIETNELLEDILIHNGNEGDEYYIPSQEFEGYDLVEDKLPLNAKGKMSIDLTEVKYYYRYRSEVVVNYIDKYSKKLIYSENLCGHENDEYKTIPKQFEKYKIDETQLPENNSGKIQKNVITVTYFLISKSSGVDVNYIDETTGEKIADSESYEGYEGDIYKTNAQEIKGYHLIRNSENTTGKMQKEKITVDYYYLKESKVIINYIDIITNDFLKQEELIGLESKDYETSSKEFERYKIVNEKSPDNAKGKFLREEQTVNYYYIYIPKVTINHVDQQNLRIMNTTTEEYQEGNKIITNSIDIPFYKLVEKPEKEEYILSKEDITVNYYYRQLEFNIRVEQIIDKIIFNGLEKNINQKIAKLEIPKTTENNDIQIYHKIQVSNVSEINGNTELYCTIPDGYEIVSVNAKNEIIDGKIKINIEDIEVGETREYIVVLHNTEDNFIGNIYSGVVSKNSTNEAGFEEITLQDNQDETEVIISVSTGIENNLKVILYIILLISIVLLVGLLFVIFLTKGAKIEE